MGRQRGAAAIEQWKFQTVIDMAKALPHHFRQISDLPHTLTERERESPPSARPPSRP